MLSELVVTNPRGNERPNVNVDDSTVTVKRGHAASINGTFGDRDGEPVTLTTNVGTVTTSGATTSPGASTGLAATASCT